MARDWYGGKRQCHSGRVISGVLFTLSEYPWQNKADIMKTIQDYCDILYFFLTSPKDNGLCCNIFDVACRCWGFFHVLPYHSSQNVSNH